MHRVYQAQLNCTLRNMYAMTGRSWKFFNDPRWSRSSRSNRKRTGSFSLLGRCGRKDGGVCVARDSVTNDATIRYLGERTERYMSPRREVSPVVSHSRIIQRERAIRRPPAAIRFGAHEFPYFPSFAAQLRLAIRAVSPRAPNHLRRPPTNSELEKGPVAH